MSTLALEEIETAHNFFDLAGTHHIEFYVGNARQASYFYRVAMGFSLVAYAGPETGCHDRDSYVLQQGRIRFVFTAPLKPDNEIAEHIHRHGDAVRDVALEVTNTRDAWNQTIRRGARSARLPFEGRDHRGEARMASIATYGDTIHTFVERRNYGGEFLPGYRELPEDPLARPVGLLDIDRIMGNVGGNERDRWAHFYADVMGFSLDSRDSRTARPREADRETGPDAWAAISKRTANGRDRLKFSLNELPEGVQGCQMDRYLEFHHGPGVQCIALATADIQKTVTAMRKRGVEFLRIPDRLPIHPAERAGLETPSDDELARLGIQPAEDDEGRILQILTKPVEDRPTLFFKIIQRMDNRTLGKIGPRIL